MKRSGRPDTSAMMCDKSACACEQHVVGRAALHELTGILLDPLFLFIDAWQIGKIDAVRMRHQNQPALLPAE